MIMCIAIMILFLAGLVFYVQKTNPTAMMSCENYDPTNTFGSYGVQPPIQEEKAGSAYGLRPVEPRSEYVFKSDGYTTSDGVVHADKLCELYPNHKGYMTDLKERVQKWVYAGLAAVVLLLLWNRRKDLKKSWNEVPEDPYED